jgi:hypothetical protein
MVKIAFIFVLITVFGFNFAKNSQIQATLKMSVFDLNYLHHGTLSPFIINTTIPVLIFTFLHFFHVSFFKYELTFSSHL